MVGRLGVEKDCVDFCVVLFNGEHSFFPFAVSWSDGVMNSCS